MSAILGIIGGLLVLLAWLFETEESFRKHKTLVDLKFATIYFFGLLFLMVYAFIIDEPIFFWLEVAILIIVLFEISYTLNFKIFKYKKKGFESGETYHSDSPYTSKSTPYTMESQYSMKKKKDDKR